MSNIGYVSINKLHNVLFEFDGLEIEILASKQLREVKCVKEYDKTNGYIVLDTNYGEEFFCLEETVEDMSLADRINVSKRLKDIERFEVRSV